jgi:hypothetical protein
VTMEIKTEIEADLEEFHQREEEFGHPEGQL